MSRFTVTDLKLDGLKVIERQQMGDSRGFLSRIFCAQELAFAGWSQPIAQINYTYTQKKGTVRGMHYQRPPYSEMKLVSCLHGAVFDVVVDVRAGSPTFLQWQAVELSASNQRALLIPIGFAHGFQTLVADCELIYLHTKSHEPSSEDGLNANDPMLSIKWPFPISELSARDREHLMLDPIFMGLIL